MSHAHHSVPSFEDDGIDRLYAELSDLRAWVAPEHCPEPHQLLAESQASPPRRAREALDLARHLRRAARSALDELARFAPVPVDAPKSCRCGQTDNHSLPPDLETQSIELMLG
jgi:hypothetical protein